MSWSTASQKWFVQLKVDGRTLCLGMFDDPAEAADVYNEAVERYRDFGSAVK